jgi:hypothetical protein
MPHLPAHAGFYEWIYTLIGLSIFTLFLVLNLPHIIKWGEPVRVWQDYLWRSIFRLVMVKSGLRAWLQRNNRSQGDEETELEENLAP